jgi:hypothetical protein
MAKQVVKLLSRIGISRPRRHYRGSGTGPFAPSHPGLPMRRGRTWVSGANDSRRYRRLRHQRTPRAQHHHRALGGRTPGGLTSGSAHVIAYYTPPLGDLRPLAHDLESCAGADVLSLSRNFSRQSDELVPDGLST